MSAISSFMPRGSNVAVDSSAARQVTGGSGQFRIFNKTTANAWLAWAAANPDGSQPTMPSAGAPAVGTPVAGVIGMVGTSVETFTLPQGAYFQASSGATFEIIAGEGI